jgi:hypothetical protein
MAKNKPNAPNQPPQPTKTPEPGPHVGWATLSEWMVFTPGAFSDGGGFVIYLGKDGKIHVKRIPPWDPQVRWELTAAMAILDHAARVQNAVIAGRLEDAAAEIIQTHADEITKIASAQVRGTAA